MRQLSSGQQGDESEGDREHEAADRAHGCIEWSRMLNVTGIPLSASLFGGFGNGACSMPREKHLETPVCGFTCILLTVPSEVRGSDPDKRCQIGRCIMRNALLQQGHHEGLYNGPH